MLCLVTLALLDMPSKPRPRWWCGAGTVEGDEPLPVPNSCVSPEHRRCGVGTTPCPLTLHCGANWRPAELKTVRFDKAKGGTGVGGAGQPASQRPAGQDREASAVLQVPGKSDRGGKQVGGGMLGYKKEAAARRCMGMG